MLPVIVGGSLTDKNKLKPVVITASLALSLLLFGLLLKSSTLLIDVPREFWALISGSIIIVFGVFTLFPEIWETISVKFKLGNTSQDLLQKSSQKKGLLGDVLIGMSLGPVFSSCSPTYALVVATVLPESFAIGALNLFVYSIGLAATMLILAVFGQSLLLRTKWAADPHSNFRKILGAVFVAIGVSVILGLDRELETWLIENGCLGSTELEYRLVEDRF
jgi:cytochrome c biogenesis protein CcdA